MKAMRNPQPEILELVVATCRSWIQRAWAGAAGFQVEHRLRQVLADSSSRDSSVVPGALCCGNMRPVSLGWLAVYLQAGAVALPRLGYGK